MKKLTATGCELCKATGGTLLWQDECCRIVMIADEHYPGYCRVILQDHIAEMTELDGPSRARLMKAVFATEGALRELMKPDKINLASLGNMTPHLHWHVVPRYADDRHFPNAIWGDVQREPAARRTPPAPSLLSSLLSQAMERT